MRLSVEKTVQHVFLVLPEIKGEGSAYAHGALYA